MTLSKIQYVVFESWSCNFVGTRGGRRRLERDSCRREQSDTEWTGVGRQAVSQSGRRADRQARDAGMMANGCIARAWRRDTDASPSGAKAKTAEWNYSCSIVYNGRINGLNRRRTTRSLFVIAQRSAASESQCSVRMPEVAREKSRQSYCILIIFFEIYEPNIEEKLHPLMSQASWSLVTTGDGGGNEKCRSCLSSAHLTKKVDCDDFKAGAAPCCDNRNARFCFDLKAIELPNLPSSSISTGNLVKIKIKQTMREVIFVHRYNDLTALNASDVPMPQTRPRLSHKGEPANRWRRETSNFVFRFEFKYFETC
ncbi:hypothetical protein ALC53_09288 [Atta colombica]|uniref:Uncharacterized protein n=1 Tax=Atta colombica TaxID=520822 RepID=A0A195B7M3_9HYME|nr:hypothetical protein ALC53_09288 [Atta colombica]